MSRPVRYVGFKMSSACAAALIARARSGVSRTCQRLFCFNNLILMLIVFNLCVCVFIHAFNLSRAKCMFADISCMLCFFFLFHVYPSDVHESCSSVADIYVLEIQPGSDFFSPRARTSWPPIHSRIGKKSRH